MQIIKGQNAYKRRVGVDDRHGMGRGCSYQCKKSRSLFMTFFTLPYSGPQTSHMRRLRLCILKVCETRKDAVK